MEAVSASSGSGSSRIRQTADISQSDLSDSAPALELAISGGRQVPIRAVHITSQLTGLGLKVLEPKVDSGSKLGVPCAAAPPPPPPSE